MSEKSALIISTLKRIGYYENAVTIAHINRTTIQEVTEHHRNPHIARARHFIWALIRYQTKGRVSFPTIGKWWGGYDHTTIMNGIRKLEFEYGGEEQLKGKLAEMLPTLELESLPEVVDEMKRFVVRGYVRLPVTLVVEASSEEQALLIAKRKRLKSVTQSDMKEWKISTTGEEPIEVTQAIQGG